MEVQILSRVPISPSPPLSNPLTLPLSHLDTDINLHVTFRTLRLYSPPTTSPDHKDPFLIISPEAVSSALSFFFPLAGSLKRRAHDDARLEVQCTPYDTIPLIRAVSEARLSDLNECTPDSVFLNRLAPDLEQANYEADVIRPLLAIQITKFSCGGFAFGMCVHHALCDGAGANKFLSCLARFARGSPSQSIHHPLWNRSELLRPRNPPHINVPFDKVIGIDAEVLKIGTYLKQEKEINWGNCCVVKECFFVSEKCVEMFRKRLNEEAGSGVSFTTFEVLTAFIWRARIKASHLNADEVVKMVYSMNITKTLTPPLPSNYWGNVCVPVYISLTAHELTTQPLFKTASLIRATKRSINNEYVRSYIDFQELNHAKGIYAGKRVSAFTDWRRLGHSEVDFGWGPPVSVMPLSWRLLGSVEPCFLLNCRREGNGFEVLTCLDERHLVAFKEDMKVFLE